MSLVQNNYVMAIKKGFSAISFLKGLLVLLVIVSCSKSEDEDTEIVINNGTYIFYQGQPNSENQLLSEIYNPEEKATTFVYGSTDGNGNPALSQGIAYKVDNSNRIDYAVLDEDQRVSFLYSTTNDVKDNLVYSITYPDDNLVNLVVIDRDWDTSEDQILEFKTVEVDDDKFTPYDLLTNKDGTDSFWKDMNGFTALQLLKVIGVVAVVGVIVGLGGTKLAIAGMFVALSASSNVSATEVISTPNPNAPAAPLDNTSMSVNQCNSSNFILVVSGGPDNLLTATVFGGSSSSYNFYWSSGESSTNTSSANITVPGPGSYFVIAQDENGCTAYAPAIVREIDSTPSFRWMMDFQNSCLNDQNTFGYAGGGGNNFEIKFDRDNKTVSGLPDESDFIGPYLSNYYTYLNGLLTITTTFNADPNCSGQQVVLESKYELYFNEERGVFEGPWTIRNLTTDGCNSQRYCYGSARLYPF